MVKQRFLALDIMRGLTLALMILVNSPGSWNYVYAPLAHAEWHGATPTDFVFPFFLFMVGAALVFSQKSLAAASHADRVKKILKRTLLLFLIGVFLNAFPFIKPVEDWRILGVLQRIALAYGLAALIVVYCNRAVRLVIAGAILLGYWALLQFSVDPYSLEHSVVRKLDLALLGASHLWQGKGIPFDPEGLLSTFPSVVNVLMGVEAVTLLSSNTSRASAIQRLLLLGGVLIALGCLWGQVFPINKSLWTSPFVLLTSGVAIWVLSLLVVVESTPVQKLLMPFTAFGMNPLFIYAASFMGETLLWVIPVGDTSLYTTCFNVLATYFSPYSASLLFAVINVVFYFSIAWVLQRKKIVIAL